MKRRTKIIATLGPALDEGDALARLISAGADVLRVNLSHASPRQQLERVQRARLLKPDVAIMVDLCGPKLRLGELPEELLVKANAEVILGAGGVPVADPSFYDRVRPGDPVYIADGTIALEATVVGRDFVKCRVIVGGVIRSRKGINLPLDVSALPCLTEKDRADVADIDILQADFVALSYVRHEDDLTELRKLTNLPIVAKIEKQQALDRLQQIIASADAVMVARGDLGVEIPIERVPANQKKLIREANRVGHTVITATQMLMSMVSSPLPTRAEVTDVANAVLDGTDCVMLSEETAVGRDPAGAVNMMVRVLSETEPLLPDHEGPSRAIPENALAYAAAKLAQDIGAAAIVAPTRTGISALRLAAFRPKQPILAYSRVPATTRRLHMAWGVTPIDLTVPRGVDALDATLAAARRDLPAGSRIILLDISPSHPGVASLVNVMTL